MVLLVSKEDHCLADLLHRWRSGDLECEITSVISNHEDLRSFVEWHGIPFRSRYRCRPHPAGKAAAFHEIESIFDPRRAATSWSWPATCRFSRRPCVIVTGGAS